MMVMDWATAVAAVADPRMARIRKVLIMLACGNFPNSTGKPVPSRQQIDELNAFIEGLLWPILSNCRRGNPSLVCEHILSLFGCGLYQGPHLWMARDDIHRQAFGRQRVGHHRPDRGDGYL